MLDTFSSQETMSQGLFSKSSTQLSPMRLPPPQSNQKRERSLWDAECPTNPPLVLMSRSSRLSRQRQSVKHGRWRWKDRGKAPYERIDRDVARRYELISRIGRGCLNGERGRRWWFWAKPPLSGSFFGGENVGRAKMSCRKQRAHTTRDAFRIRDFSFFWKLYN